MGNCQTKGAAVVAERQAPLDSRSYSIDLGGNDSDDTSIEDARLLHAKASDEDKNSGHQGSESSERKTSNLKPLGPSELEETIAAGPRISSDQITQPQVNRTRMSIPKIPKAANEDKQCLYASVSFPVMDELDELVASMSMPMEPTEDDLEEQNEDDAGYVSSSSSSAAGSPQATDGAMVPFLGSPALIANANTNASSSATIDAEPNACESTSAIETQLAVSESKDFCAYGLSKEEASAAAALSGGTQMVVVQEYQNQETEGSAQVPSTRHFTFQDVNVAEKVRDTSPEMMITPPNDPDKAYPQDLYLSPPTPENEIDEGDGHGFLVLPPFAPESEQANTTDIVPLPTASSHNYGEFLSSANAKACAKPIVKQDTREHTTTGDMPKHPTKKSEVTQPSENEVDAIVEFVGHSIVPVSHPTSQSDVLATSSRRSPVDSLVPFEMGGEDKFVHDFSDDDRDDAPADDCVKSETRDVVEERRGSDEKRSPVEEEVEVQLGVSESSMISGLLVASAEELKRKNSEEITAIVETRHSSRNAYGRTEVAIESSKKGCEAVKGVESPKEESGAIYPTKSHETKENIKKEEANPRPGSGEQKLPMKAEPMPKVDAPCPDAATFNVALSTEHAEGEVSAAAATTKEKERSVLVDGMPQINQGSTPALKPSSGVPSGGASVASMTHLSRRARNLRKNKSQAYTKKTSDDTEASETAPVDYLCITESRSVDTEVSDLHSVFTDATPRIPTKVVTATASSTTSTRGRISHRSAQIERLRSRSTTRRGRVSELPTGDKCPNSSEEEPARSPVYDVSLPPKAAETCGKNGQSRHSTASARKLAKVRQARSRSRSVTRQKTVPSADIAKVEETKAVAVDQEEKRSKDNSSDIPVNEERSSITDEEASASDRHGRHRPHSSSISRPRTLSERKALASASDTASVDEEKSTVSDATETKRPTSRAHSRTRLSERKARAARMKPASQQTLSSVSSLESSPSIETTETTSSAETNAENNAGVGNNRTSPSEVDEGSKKTHKELSSKEKMKKKRLERARRLRAIQN